MQTNYTPAQQAAITSDMLLTSLVKCQFAKGEEKQQLMNLLEMYRREIYDDINGMDKHDTMLVNVFHVIYSYLQNKD